LASNSPQIQAALADRSGARASIGASNGVAAAHVADQVAEARKNFVHRPGIAPKSPPDRDRRRTTGHELALMALPARRAMPNRSGTQWLTPYRSARFPISCSAESIPPKASGSAGPEIGSREQRPRQPPLLGGGRKINPASSAVIFFCGLGRSGGAGKGPRSTQISFVPNAMAVSIDVSRRAITRSTSAPNRFPSRRYPPISSQLLILRRKQMPKITFAGGGQFGQIQSRQVGVKNHPRKTAERAMRGAFGTSSVTALPSPKTSGSP